MYKLIFLLFTFLPISQASHGHGMGRYEELTADTIKASDYLKSFFKINKDKLALKNVKIVDGTAGEIKNSQTILIVKNRIFKVGDTSEVDISEDFSIIDLSGRTVIPGIVGTHNHMRLPQGAMLYTSPKLYLAAGVTTIQTCGTGNPKEEIEIANAIKNGLQPGPDIINSGPYITDPSGKGNFIRFYNEDKLRDTIRYWAEHGIKWFKVYRHTRPKDLAIVIDEAKKYGAKVTGHLCATTFEEAAHLGISAIEHGFLHSYDYAEGKEADLCSGSTDFRTDLDINSEEVKNIHQLLIDRNVAISSTLAIFEAQARGVAEPRSLAALSSIHREQYQERRKRMDEEGDKWYFKEKWLYQAMAYELAFYKSGGLLTAGPDPGLHNLPGYGDQKNYELLIEAGFKTEEAIQVMTSNGAKLLGLNDTGEIRENYIANLVVLHTDLETNPKGIQEVELVIKDGNVYDPIKLTSPTLGHVGSESDNDMTYFGLSPPGNEPEIFAAHQISKPDRHEFGSVFSKDGKEFFFGIDTEGKAEIWSSKLSNGVWTDAEVVLTHKDYSFNDPMLSPNEDRLYFISDMALNGYGEKKDYDIWYVERLREHWSAPKNIGSPINTVANEYYISFGNDGSMYYASNFNSERKDSKNFDVFRSASVNGKYQNPIKLKSKINTKYYEADAFVASDETYLIFSSIRENGYGQGDLYISFKDQEGNWTEAKNMGSEINNEHHQLCPFVSKDGKYLFFTSNKDIYWVDAKIIEKYR
ncbi:amidohydrolase family protein [Belliella marina]|uniref:Amidohydrolase family protein n=1 Tax=Belliella marina TaxID=1644146 RepID=A0ABW4VK18_9BACT